MRVHSNNTIAKMKLLRRRGHSINELVHEFSVPKTTVWHHVHKVSVLPECFSELKAKRGGSALRFIARTQEAEKQAKDILGGPRREKAIALVMLYWAEGRKKGCEFINSDGNMIRLYIKILHDVFGITKKDLIPTIRVFTGMNKQECLSYWISVTGLPEQEFIVRLNDGGTRGRTRYGMCRIYVRKGSQYLKIINALINQIIKEM
jgi:hypothetical protein